MPALIQISAVHALRNEKKMPNPMGFHNDEMELKKGVSVREALEMEKEIRQLEAELLSGES